MRTFATAVVEQWGAVCFSLSHGIAGNEFEQLTRDVMYGLHQGMYDV